MKTLLTLTILILSCSPSGMCFTPCSNVTTQIEQQTGVFECDVMSTCAAKWDVNLRPLTQCELNQCVVSFFEQSLECRQYTSELMHCLSRNNCMTVDCANYVSAEMEKQCTL